MREYLSSIDIECITITQYSSNLPLRLPCYYDILWISTINASLLDVKYLLLLIILLNKAVNTNDEIMYLFRAESVLRSAMSLIIFYAHECDTLTICDIYFIYCSVIYIVCEHILSHGLLLNVHLGLALLTEMNTTQTTLYLLYLECQRQRRCSTYGAWSMVIPVVFNVVNYIVSVGRGFQSCDYLPVYTIILYYVYVLVHPISRLAIIIHSLYYLSDNMTERRCSFILYISLVLRRCNSMIILPNRYLTHLVDGKVQNVKL